jgi:hypothetical protein
MLIVLKSGSLNLLELSGPVMLLLYFLTTQSGVLVEKLLVSQLVKNSPEFCGTHNSPAPVAVLAI